MKKLKRAVIKEELVELTGDFRPALILNQFIYWIERMYDTDKYILEEKERALKHEIEVSIDESKGWVYKTAEDLNEELMIGMSVPTIRKYIKQLVEQGYLIQRKNPKYKWDKTMQYRVGLYKIQLDLGKMGYVLEGFKLLPNIKIVEEIEEIEESENIEVDENKKDLPVGADKPNENQNINDNNSIPQNKEKDSSESEKNHFGNNYQNNKDNQEEINYEKIAYENLKDNPIFQQLPEVAKQARLISEINKIKTLGLYR